MRSPPLAPASPSCPHAKASVAISELEIGRLRRLSPSMLVVGGCVTLAAGRGVWCGVGVPAFGGRLVLWLFSGGSRSGVRAGRSCHRRPPPVILGSAHGDAVASRAAHGTAWRRVHGTIATNGQLLRRGRRRGYAPPLPIRFSAAASASSAAAVSCDDKLRGASRDPDQYNVLCLRGILDWAVDAVLYLRALASDSVICAGGIAFALP